MAHLALVFVLLAALLIPLLMAKFKITFLPTAVAEILVGILLGQSGLHLIAMNDTLSQLSSLGVTILIFLSGMEIDFSLFGPKQTSEQSQRSPLTIAMFSFATVLMMSAGLGWFLKATGLFDDILLATILFSTIALGIVIAALKEQEILSKPLGQTILLIAVLGEILPLLALTVYSALNQPGSKSVWLLSLIFLAAIYLLIRFKAIYRFFAKIDKTTTQLDIRLAFFLIITLVSIAEQVGAESILGAFLAGMVMKLLRPREETEDKLTSIGYGFFIPIFFIMTGAQLDLAALFSNYKTLLLIPIFYLGFILAKSLIYFILRTQFKPTNALAATSLSATTITLVLPILTVGQNLNVITSQQADVFTIAAILSCITGPIGFNRFFKPEKSDLLNKSVHFLGANIMTMPIAQQLINDNYPVTLFTNHQQNFDTYKSKGPLVFIEEFTEENLLAHHFFEADILVLGYLNHEINYQIAKLALKHQVKRIIVRFEAKDILNDQYDELKAAGVEIFNTFEANISLLRSLIVTPATLAIIDDTDAGLFEMTVNNRRFTGLQISNLPFVNHVTISRIYRDGQLIVPHGDTQIHFKDHLILTGNKELMPAIRRQLEKLN